MDGKQPQQLRELAAWHREFAERAGSSVIWDGRLRLADECDAEADRIERRREAASRRTEAPSSTNARRADLER